MSRSKKAARAAIDLLVEGRKRAPRLAQIAALVNEHFPKGYTAEVISSWSDTDRKIPGARMRHPGKGRRGNRLFARTARRSRRSPASLTTPVLAISVGAGRGGGSRK